MSAPRLVVTHYAKKQMDAILDYIEIEQRNVKGAHTVMIAFYKAFESLETFPQAGRERPELTDRPLRFWNVLSYVIVYDSVVLPARVVRIYHSAQDVKRLLAEAHDLP
jgi:plasmid stabilization system protein ParE